MHMADALISPAVGGVMWAATAGLTAYAAKKVKKSLDDQKVPLMGVLGAFVFAAQMVNFSIPGTGSSGHLGGGLLLCILLGPYAAFLTMASILTVQALFFADGGLLALGCNIFNMGFFPCFIAYPLIYKPLAGENPSQARLIFGSIVAAVFGLQLGAFGVVLETLFSGISELPFGTFVILMQPIHLAIGLVEGVVIAAVVSFVWKAAPEVLAQAAKNQPIGQFSVKKLVTALLILALVTGCGVSLLASSDPDGLEWSIQKVSGEEELKSTDGVHTFFSEMQEKIALLPDYNFKSTEVAAAKDKGNETTESKDWPAVDAGTSVAGLVGSLLTLILAYSIARGLRSCTR
ncbi:MAG TPA: energy-coupling factor ABC transporter permease [Patescibacteria group bacterium]|nr:energy-coupling factor ABC transporter permease [Patescibacteria group bacterium]